MYMLDALDTLKSIFRSSLLKPVKGLFQKHDEVVAQLQYHDSDEEDEEPFDLCVFCANENAKRFSRFVFYMRYVCGGWASYTQANLYTVRVSTRSARRAKNASLGDIQRCKSVQCVVRTYVLRRYKR